MRYQKVRELSKETVLLQATATGKTVSADQVDVKANLKEAFRLELHNEIRKLAAEEGGVQATGLIKYQGLEKVENHFYLVRKNEKDLTGLEPYQPASLDEVVPVLRQLAQIMDAYHRQGMFFGGLSTGLLQRNQAGEVFLQDPPVLNHLASLLEGNYEFSMPLEVIKGQAWGAKADVFSWGELAYRYLTGTAPFAAAQPEDRAAKIIGGMVIDPRNMQPKLSEAFSRLLVACLALEAQRRPTAGELLRQLETLVSQKNCLASAEEVAAFEEKAAIYRKRQQSQERFQLWWRKYGVTSCGIVAGVLVLSLITFVPKKTTLNPKTTPEQVVNYYFKGIRTVNVALLDETVYRTKHDFSDTISNIHVINTTRKASEMKAGGEDAIKVQLETLKITKEHADVESVIYRVKYRIKFAMVNENDYFDREDRFKLTRVKRVWRITKITVLKEKRRSQKIAVPQSSAQPAK